MSQTMTFRLPDDLALRLRDESEASGVPQARIVRRALEAHFLDTEPEDSEAVGRMAEDLDTPGTSTGPCLTCPSPGCDFSAISPAAKCPVHGRTVR